MVKFGVSLGTPGTAKRSVTMDAPVFDSFERRNVTGGVTLDHTTVPLDADGRRVIRAGEIVGKIADTELYAPWDSTANDGREVPRGVVEATNEVTAGNSFIGIADVCRVHVARMPRQFTAAEWQRLSNGVYVSITPVEPYEVPGPTAIDVALSPDTAQTLAVGATLQFTPVFNPTDTVNRSGTWASSNPAAATVDQNGLVTGVAAGSTNIAFATQVGGKTTAPVAVTVS